MAFNSTNIGIDTVNKFNQLGNHVVDSLLDIATPILTNVSGINVQQMNQWSPYSEVHHTQNEIKIMVNLPGVVKENINVILKSRSLNLSAQTSLSSEGWGHINERTYQKNFNIPDNIKNSDLELNFKDGVLKIIVHKNNFTDTEGERVEIN